MGCVFTWQRDNLVPWYVYQKGQVFSWQRGNLWYHDTCTSINWDACFANKETILVRWYIYQRDCCLVDKETIDDQHHGTSSKWDVCFLDKEKIVDTLVHLSKRMGVYLTKENGWYLDTSIKMGECLVDKEIIVVTLIHLPKGIGV